MAKKVGESVLNPKNYILLPVYPNSQNGLRRGSNMSDGFQYETNFIDMNTKIKNLKTSTIELKERVFVDKPNRK